MAHFVDKDALIAEIEKRQRILDLDNPFGRGGMVELECLKDTIDTLEVKEVDLEKEFSQWWKCERAKDYNVDILYERYPNVSMKLAKHFFELGLKAQKGE